MTGRDIIRYMNERGPDTSSRVEIGDIPTQAIADIFVGQLARTARLRKAHEGELNSAGKLLLDKIINARFCDLRDLGYGDRALQIIKSPEMLET